MNWMNSEWTKMYLYNFILFWEKYITITICKKNSVTKMLNKPVNGFNFVLVEHSNITVYHPY